jgi:diguanylate cyclase (GGDEF)-like protein
MLEKRAPVTKLKAGSQQDVWPLANATQAVEELVHLVRALQPAGWTFTPVSSPVSEVDLRHHPGVDVVPVVLPDGDAIGTIRCPREATGDPADATLRVLLQTVVLLVAMERRGFAAVNRATEAERESRLDALTGLPNRRMWDEAVAREQARCRRYGLSALVAVVDLDDLKEVNDHQGHLAGDVLIRVAAQALVSAVREVDLVARLGGDEFAVLAVAYEDDATDPFADRIRRTLDDNGVAASVGVAVAGPETSLQQALDAADHTMYEVKATRKDRTGGG